MIFVILIGICFLGWIIYKILDKTRYDNVCIAFAVITTVLIVITVIAGLLALATQLDGYAELKAYQERYDMLVYQLENGLYEGENKVGLQALYNEITDYNTDVVRGQTARKLWWSRPFYGWDYDQLELIKPPNI